MAPAKLTTEKDYDDIPGTYVFDADRSRRVSLAVALTVLNELSLDQTGDREPKNDACW